MNQVPKWVWYVAAAVALYYFVFRRSISGGGIATGTVSIGSGAQATPYPGYPVGTAPITALQQPGLMYGPQVPTTNSGAAWLGAAGQFIGGLGSAASGILGALGGAGVIGSGASSSSGSSWGGGYGGGGQTYVDDGWNTGLSDSSDPFSFDLF